MPAVVPITDLDKAIALALEQIQNGRAIAAQNKITTDMPPEQCRVDFDFVVLIPGGLNAARRTEETSPQGASKTVSEEGVTVQTTVRGPTTENVSQNESGQSVTESGITNQSGNQSSSQGLGRGSQTVTKFED